MRKPSSTTGLAERTAAVVDVESEAEIEAPREVEQVPRPTDDKAKETGRRREIGTATRASDRDESEA